MLMKDLDEVRLALLRKLKLKFINNNTCSMSLKILNQEIDEITDTNS
ncbi:hypothetical protein Molly5_145 [Maribacter phage Molly_5]|uniref:Uncharacterized protein n=1 Tax=Maribacter phage Molly_1 TaxID=2745685 RepID=A0A8E4UY82_9CAUD|nr:hypothetical protein M1M29_gp144 [Maribacter phage Molly_1]QQO97638.1 hypothetical protein Molly2_144 [Maribacter phage Molly_2]QQO97838.1 hypothetical protein Molly3_144 [Maribacter phage Molly_3]QQO98039.1 hypothetical protein Molly4_145 [Maribacter phage Molly_4]QQO98239.1 hypothetical protein Molly5_145 [Maribacter phage Molly_5]QQO97438.1 hypothetical protein Molly1_144 [Maribacter phage Molly_1]